MRIDTLTTAFFIFLLLLAAPLQNPGWTRPHMIVWNVGQGQWVTITYPQYCAHFDSGGEIMPPKDLLTGFCRGKKNLHYLSHFDWDHINFIVKARRLLPNLCRALSPQDHTRLSRQKLYSQLPECPNRNVRRVFPNAKLGLSRQHFNSNDGSQVFFIEKILLPGDSTKKAERLWARTKSLRAVEILLLGHHGSDTSSSWLLLNHLPNLRMAISSSRRQKYGHPHWQVCNRLLAKKTPLLRTEAWNHLIIEL